MFTDFLLASLHHLAVFSLAAVLAAEFTLIRNPLNAVTIRRLARIDVHFGALAALAVVAGAARVVWGAKGYGYYLANHVFWLKMLLFLAVGLLSIAPTLRFVAWSRAARADAGFAPPAGEVSSVKRLIWIEAGLFLLIPIAAAAMARGYGLE